MLGWDDYFLNIADAVKEKSKDPSIKVGAVIVGPEHQIVSTGFNGFPRGVNELIPGRWERPRKYEYVEHAERNAIYNAARHGVVLRGCVMYMVGFGSHACADCARAIIQSGIVRLVGRSSPIPQRWENNFGTAEIMLNEAGVEVLTVDE